MTFPSRIDIAARPDSKPTVPDPFDRILDTITNASKGQWATFTVNVIEHARTIKMPRRDLLRVLAILGIADSSRPARRSLDGKTVPSRGLCTGCNTRQGLMLDGRVASHKKANDHCPGRHQPPATEPAVVAS
jgi:hypothetical protein